MSVAENEWLSFARVIIILICKSSRNGDGGGAFAALVALLASCSHHACVGIKQCPYLASASRNRLTAILRQAVVVPKRGGYRHSLLACCGGENAKL